MYTLTDQRLKFTRGVLSKVTEDLELYRVRDTKFSQGVFERMVGLGNIELLSTDETSPTIHLRYIADAEGVLGELQFPDAPALDAWLRSQRERRVNSMRRDLERQVRALEGAGDAVSAAASRRCPRCPPAPAPAAR